FFFQAEDGIRDFHVTGVQTCALPISSDEPIGPTNPRAIWESAGYVRMLPKLFDHLRSTLGDDVQLLHDVHERVQLNEAINLCKRSEERRVGRECRCRR